MVHRHVKNNPNFKSAVPYITGWKDIINVDKVVSQHPFVIGTFVRQQVEDWREAHIKILREKLNPLLVQFAELSSQQATNQQLDPNSLEVDGSSSAQVSDQNHQQQAETEQQTLAELKRKIATIEYDIETIRYAIPDRFKHR